MSATKNQLGQLEEIVLLATLRLEGNGYGASIQETIEEKTGRDISIGALYATLDRLERKGFVSSRQGEATPERGGRAKRYFKVEAAGMQALSETHRTRAKLTEGLRLRWV
jgi:PadR family transcriptional regulator, regulatory protein PadR